MSNPLTIIYITCKSRSGSTLLDLLISSHSQVTSLGEINLLSARRKKAKRKKARRKKSPLESRCTCTNTILDCLFWQGVEQFSGIPLQELDVDSEDPVIFKQHNRAIFQAAAAVSGSEFIIDSSKDTRRLEKLVAIKDFNIKPIHLVRHPGGVVYSHIKSGKNWLTSTRQYTAHFMRTRRLLENRHSFFTIYYEELASAPQQTLAKLMKWLELPFQETQLNWKSTPHHQIAGNKMRFSEDSQIKLDNVWEKKLSWIQKITIAWMTFPTRHCSTRLYYLLMPVWQLQGFGKGFIKLIKHLRKKSRWKKIIQEEI